MSSLRSLYHRFPTKHDVPPLCEACGGRGRYGEFCPELLTRLLKENTQLHALRDVVSIVERELRADVRPLAYLDSVVSRSVQDWSDRLRAALDAADEAIKKHQGIKPTGARTTKEAEIER